MTNKHSAPSCKSGRGGIDNRYTDMKQLCKALGIDLPRLSQMSGVPVHELQRIEAGEMFR